MTNQLIPTFAGELAGEIQQLIDGRALHDFISSGTKYQDWIERRINDYGFTQGIDYCVVLKKENRAGWFGSKDVVYHHLSMDMAKELSMVEKSEIGRKARTYFIQMEKLIRQEIPAVFRRPHETRPGQVESLQMERMKQALLAAYPAWKKIKRYFEMGLTQKEIGRLIRRSDSTVRRHLDKMTACGVINRTINPLLSAYGKRGNAKRLEFVGGDHGNR